MTAVFARKGLLLLAPLVGAVGCSSGAPKGGSVDAAAHDAAARDSSGRGADARVPVRDAGRRDAGERDAPPVDAAVDVILDPSNCVPPGTPNNAAGVGGYCSPGGGQCAHAGPDASATICTGDFGTIVPPHAWFCTNLCDPDGGTAACGEPGPPCVLAEGEPVCLPDACKAFLASADGGAADGGANDATETIEVGGLSRAYIVHMPAGYTGEMPVPLVLDFHPLDVTASEWKAATTWASTADKQGFIVVWPQGYMNSWNVGRCCDPSLGAAVDDVAFTRAIITQVSSAASVDPARIYATGCSNGGGMSYKLACDAADVIAAVAPVDFDCVTGATNNPSCGSCTPSRPISECQFRGTADMDVPYDGGATPVVAGLDFPGAKANFATWASIDDCTGTPKVETGQPACQEYTTCGDGADVTLCTVDNGTHCGSYGIFPIVDIAWAMFLQHTLP